MERSVILIIISEVKLVHFIEDKTQMHLGASDPVTVKVMKTSEFFCKIRCPLTQYPTVIERVCPIDIRYEGMCILHLIDL